MWTDDHLEVAMFHMQRKERTMARDLICDMEVEEATAVATAEYQGKTYYFCAEGCKQAFEKNPEKYLSKEKSPHSH